MSVKPGQAHVSFSEVDWPFGNGIVSVKEKMKDKNRREDIRGAHRSDDFHRNRCRRASWQARSIGRSLPSMRALCRVESRPVGLCVGVSRGS